MFDEINDLLNRVCFMDAPFETRLEIAETVVRTAASELAAEEVRYDYYQ